MQSSNCSGPHSGASYDEFMIRILKKKNLELDEQIQENEKEQEDLLEQLMTEVGSSSWSGSDEAPGATHDQIESFSPNQIAAIKLLLETAPNVFDMGQSNVQKLINTSKSVKE